MISKYEKEGLPLEPEYKLLGFCIGAPMFAAGYSLQVYEENGVEKNGY